MSQKAHINNFSNKELEKISKELTIEQPVSKYAYSKSPSYIYVYDREGDDVIVPFGWGKPPFIRPTRNELAETKILFSGSLRPEQTKVKNEAVDSLNKTGCVIIAAYPGFGKTCLGIYLSSKISLRTLIIYHRLVLRDQWATAIKTFSPKSSTYELTATNEMKDADFYLVNAINVPKRSRDFFSKIGLVIVDECHLIMAQKLSESMKYLFPRYVIGLSATPYRTDGLDPLLSLYFGSHKIVRELYRKHLVYKVETGIKPEVKLNKMGKVDWNSVVESTCMNISRNELIVNILKKFNKLVFIVPCKRVEQAKYIEKRLKEEKESVTSLIGNNQEYDRKSRILVGTVQKLSTGFDHPSVNAMIIASDVVEYFLQYLGRAFRKENNIPTIFDIVDDYVLLKKHYKAREEIYLRHGGEIRDYME